MPCEKILWDQNGFDEAPNRDRRKEKEKITLSNPCDDVGPPIEIHLGVHREVNKWGMEIFILFYILLFLSNFCFLFFFPNFLPI